VSLNRKKNLSDLHPISLILERIIYVQSRRAIFRSGRACANAVVDAMAPLIEKLGKEEGRDGLILLGTTMVSAGVGLLRECLGDGETAKFIDQVRTELSTDPSVVQ
jgi:hypothetical protein